MRYKAKKGGPGGLEADDEYIERIVGSIYLLGAICITPGARLTSVCLRV